MFVSRGFFAQWSGPLSSIFSSAAEITVSLSASGTENLVVHFTDTNTHTYRHVGDTHALYFQTTIVCEREEGCAKPTMWCVRMMLNGASLVSPYSEVTLSSQSAPQMN